jgi:hypothetical protein
MRPAEPNDQDSPALGRAGACKLQPFDRFAGGHYISSAPTDAIPGALASESLEPLSLIVSTHLAEVLCIAHLMTNQCNKASERWTFDPNLAVADYQPGEALAQKLRHDGAVFVFPACTTPCKADTETGWYASRELDPPSWLPAWVLLPTEPGTSSTTTTKTVGKLSVSSMSSRRGGWDNRALDRPGSCSTISGETRARSAERRARSGRSRPWRSKRAKGHSLSCPFSAPSS